MAGPMIRLVTLDVTNTLIRVAGSPGYQYAYIAHQHGLKVDESLLTSLFFKNYKHYSFKYPNFGTQSSMSAQSWWALLVKDCFHTADKRISEGTLDKLADDLYYHFTTSKAWEFMPGAVDALKDLRQHPLKIGVISNWDDRLYGVLQVMGLQPLFDFVLPSMVTGLEKPDAAIFELALQKAGCLPQEAVHFGDNIEKDFLGARKVGMNAYLMASSPVQHSDLDQSLVVASVQDFVNAIRSKLRTKISLDHRGDV